ncbi:hypothetical protein J2D73_13195 [Acetobacter sacchari]|uniref:COQ9 C-terminal domain-containing protein n=1 Tax=Acetobacter sacchari TaxID=2661687 RepID=A0ABS3LXY3_9PROT|nr:hypothetical protein [Acetobacter sacchari]
MIGLATRLAVPRAIECSEERDSALKAFAREAGQAGWSIATLQRAAGPDADLLFPGGLREVTEAWGDLADRWMLAAMAGSEAAEPRLSRRVRRAVLERLDALTPYKAAERRAVAFLTRPCGQAAAARIAMRTVNAIWEAAGDEATGFTWATKRVSLSAVYGPTFATWLASDDRGKVERILDAGLERTRRIGACRQKLSTRFRPGVG